MDQQRIGVFLKQLRKEKNLTQEQFAERFNTSRRTVSRWETGNNLPDIDVLIELSDFYEVDLREILDGKRRSEQMNDEVKETVLKAAELENEKQTKQTKYVICFFIVGIAGALISQVLYMIPMEENFFTGFLRGSLAGLPVAAMIFGLFYMGMVLSNLKREKERILEK